MVSHNNTASAILPASAYIWPRKLLLAVHLVAGLGFLGTSLGILVLTVAGAIGTAPGNVYPAAQMLIAWLVEPFAIAAAVTGLVQAMSSRYGVGTYWWVVIKLVITVVLAVVILATLYPRIADAAGSVLVPVTHPLTSGERTRIEVSWPVVCLLLIVNVLLGVAKPGWRVFRRGTWRSESNATDTLPTP